MDQDIDRLLAKEGAYRARQAVVQSGDWDAVALMDGELRATLSPLLFDQLVKLQADHEQERQEQKAAASALSWKRLRAAQEAMRLAEARG